MTNKLKISTRRSLENKRIAIWSSKRLPSGLIFMDVDGHASRASGQLLDNCPGAPTQSL